MALLLQRTVSVVEVSLFTVCSVVLQALKQLLIWNAGIRLGAASQFIPSLQLALLKLDEGQLLGLSVPLRIRLRKSYALLLQILKSVALLYIPGFVCCLHWFNNVIKI